MSEPYLAEIRIMGFNFPPRGWAQCDGQILPIAQYQSLYSLLGTVYGGDGRTTFALPDLRGRTPIHVGSNNNNATSHALGSRGGEEKHTLTTSEIPAHRHNVQASSDPADQNDPTDRVLAQATFPIYRGLDNAVALHPLGVATNSGGQGVENLQPFLSLNFVIALTGTYPPRN